MFKDSLREGDTAARVGGDEFVLLLPDTDGDGAAQTIGRLSRQLSEALAASNWGVSCSIGVLTIVDAAITPEGAIAAADEAMYQVKQKGKGTVEFRTLDAAVRFRGGAETDEEASS